jgi:MFS family permease
MASSMFLPYHLAELGLGDPGTIAMMMVGGAGASGVATLCFGLVRSKLSALQIFIIGFVLNGVGSLLIAFATGPIVLLAGMVLGGVGLGLVMPNVFSACAAATQPQWRARMLGFVRAGFNAGPLMAQPVLEVVYRQSNAGMTLAAIGLASFGGVVWVLLTRRQFDPYE